MVPQSKPSYASYGRKPSGVTASAYAEAADDADGAVASCELRLRVVGLSDLCFDHSSWGVNDYDHSGCTDDYNKIFSPTGAGLTWASAPSDAMDSSASPDNLWHIYGDNEVNLIGTTCGSSACADIILVLDELTQSVCMKINDRLEISNPSSAPPVDSDIGTTRYVGSIGYAETIGDEAGGEPLQGQSAGCFQKTDTPAKYTFYKVLLSQ